MPLEKRPERQPDPVHGPHRPEREDSRGSDDFFGLDVESMSPRAQLTTALAVLAPVAVGALLVFTLVPWLWWLCFVFGWTIFPAFGLLVRGSRRAGRASPPETAGSGSCSGRFVIGAS